MKVVKIVVPPDKSISHRAVMLASISEGTTRIKNLLMGDDVLRTIKAFRAMGVQIDVAAESASGGQVLQLQLLAATDVIVRGVGMHGLKKPQHPLYLGNSGTTMRILPGILAGQDFEVVLKGDRSLSKRPMRRIAEPLRMMSARVSGVRCKVKGESTDEVYPPLKIRGGKLKAIKYKSKVASAQVKSCVLLAGLFANGVTSVSEPVRSRDHTERMLKLLGCRLKAEGLRVSVCGSAKLKSPGTIEIPGDISSAAFFIVAACILPGMKVVLKDVGINPTRTGVIDILKKMRADIRITLHTSRFTLHEPVGDVTVKSSNLRGITISAKEFVRAIDEIPIIMAAACFARGATIIKGIGELRVKETDRVRSMVTNLRKLGADINVAAKLALPSDRGRASPVPNFDIAGCVGDIWNGASSAARDRMKEGIVIRGGKALHGGRVSSFGDHRTAMSMLVADLAIKGKVRVTGLACINKSFPGFSRLLHRLT